MRARKEYRLGEELSFMRIGHPWYGGLGSPGPGRVAREYYRAQQKERI